MLAVAARLQCALTRTAHGKQRGSEAARRGREQVRTTSDDGSSRRQPRHSEFVVAIVLSLLFWLSMLYSPSLGQGARGNDEGGVRG